MSVYNKIGVAAVLVQLLCLCCCASSSIIMLGNETDRVALLEFKSMISADPLEALSSWNSSTHFCQWYGVSCSERQGRVTILDLEHQKLSGSISPHIGNLSFLKVLSLTNNSLTGEIPPEIGRLHRLQWLVLHNNSLGGEIPSNISGCSALTIFGAGNNKLVGELPWHFGLLNKLEILNLPRNHLEGSIPPSLGNLSSLKKFHVGDNQLSERIPDAFGQLKYLQFLGLYINRFHGEIPASIFNLSSLTSLWLGSNQLNGNLPRNLGISLPNLESFDVSFNQLTGSVPPSLSNASNLVHLQLPSNNFTGSMPSMAGCNKLNFFVISWNSLGSGNTKDLSFLSSLTNATSLERIHIGRNNFEGRLPQDISNLSTSLKFLTFSHNKISGNIPSGIQNLINLEMLYAGNNTLSGTIPSSIGNLHSLQYLDLHGNNISGYIPSSIGNLTKLLKLYFGYNQLQGEIPTSIENCQKLLLLSLSGNNLRGSIPIQVMGLTSLSIGLGLSENQFSGALPAEVGNLKNSKELDLSHNMLSGSIPSSLGSCGSLEILNLGGNLLQGVIPSSLSSLRGIQQLDLSANNLSGQIPKFLEQMNISLLLNLSYNNFEGEVPREGAFKNSSIISVTGNSKLCGGIAELKLPPCINFVRYPNKAMSCKWKIVISTISSILLVTFMGSCLFIFWIKKRGNQGTNSGDGDMRLQQLSYQRLYMATDGFSSANLIGAGSFGSVYKGVLHENGATTSIAVKVFNLERRGASKSFMAECEALKNIRHRNLVRILTVCSGVNHQGNDFKALIYEFLANGSLEDWLHPIERINEPTRSINFLQRFNVAIDVACGVDYLHNQCGTPIVHCDLKPSNVLLDEDMVAHVGDFGLARFLSAVANPSSSSSIGIKGTVGYAPPEYGMGNEVSIQGDVYSYGILLLEMFTGRRPTGEVFSDSLNLHILVKSALSQQRTTEVVDPVLVNELRNKLATHDNYAGSSSEETRKGLEELLSSILEIGVACSSEIPEERLSMGQVLTRLSTVKDFCLVKRRGENSVTGSNKGGLVLE